MSLAEAADILGGSLIGADTRFAGVSTDTRTLKPDELFLALEGPNYDGHDFLPQAAAAGAAGALVANTDKTPLPVIAVEDTRRALGSLAAFWRKQFAIPVIAITGSNGKTTVKEMVAAIMAETGRGCSTRGNLNNDIGLPLTLLRLRPADRYAVVELGVNQRGEIHYLTAMTDPTVAVITNAAEAHLAGLGSIDDVAREKGAIFTALSADGTAVINVDDEHASLWRGLAAPRRCITFGLQHSADVTADCMTDTTGTLVSVKTTQGDINMRLPLLGRHNVANALAATATSLAAGAKLEHIKPGLEKLRQVSGRLEVKRGLNGARVIDDTYNANPASLAAGIAVLKDFPGEAVLVIGDMAELGGAAPDIHRRTGELAKRLGISRLFGIGALSKLAVDSFGKGGRHFANRNELIEALLEIMRPDMTVLVKGSRVMHLELVVEGIVERDAQGAREVTTT